MAVRVQAAAFDPGAELSAFAAGRADLGAIVTFTGIVRDLTGDLRLLRIEHYPGMTEAALAAVEAETVARWSLAACLIVHRHGDLAPGAPIMMVATAAAHRADAFAAADFLMDYLKSRAPFWKQEVSATGTTWVAARAEDEAALSRW